MQPPEARIEMPFEIALVERLLSELKDLLPYFSGKSIEQLSGNKSLFENISVIIKLHEVRFSTLLRRLLALLESLTKSTNGDDHKSMFLQQSQLILLRIITIGMYYHWHQLYAAHGINKDKAISKVDGDGSNETSFGTTPGTTGYGYYNGEYPLIYPNPLDEPIAKYAFQIGSRYFRNWNTPKGMRLITDTVDLLTHYMFYTKRTSTSQGIPLCTHMFDIPKGTNVLGRFARACLSVPGSDMNLEMQEAAAAMFSFISASNWNVVMQRAKGCLYLVVSHGDEIADLTDIRFLEFASMDISRLVQILDVFSEVFNRVKRPEQIMLAMTLRRIIWGFISRCAGTFIDMHRNNYRPSTTRIENLIDTLKTLNDPSSRSTHHPIFSQLQVLLLVLCPDAVSHIVDVLERRVESSRSKHVSFFQNLQQGLQNTNVPDTIIFGALDLFRIASVLVVYPENKVEILATKIEADLTRVLIETPQRIQQNREETTDPGIMLASFIGSQIQRDPEGSLRRYIPILSGSKSTVASEMMLVYSVEKAVGKRFFTNSAMSNTLFHKSSSKIMNDILYKNLVAIQGLDDIGPDMRTSDKRISGRRPQTHAGDKPESKVGSIFERCITQSLILTDNFNNMPGVEVKQRVETVLNILRIYYEVPQLVISGDNEIEMFESFESATNSMSICIQEQSAGLQRQTGNVLRSIFNPRLLLSWVQSEDMKFMVWCNSLQVIQAICRSIVQSMGTNTLNNHRFLLELMHDMLVLSNTILESTRHTLNSAVEIPEQSPFKVAFEIVAMLHLWADDTETTQIILECLRLKCHQHEILEEKGIGIDPTLSNRRVYLELIAGDVHQAGMYSKIAQKKAIFRAIRKYIHPTSGSQAAWQEGYKMWRMMLHTLLMKDETMRPSDAANLDKEMASIAISHSNNNVNSATKEKDEKDSHSQHTGRRKTPFYEKLTGQSKFMKRGGSNEHSNTNYGANNSASSSITSTSGVVSSTSANASTTAVSGSIGGTGFASSPSGGHNSSALGWDGFSSNRSASKFISGANLPAIINIPYLTVGELRAQWKSCTGFLLSTSGACIPDDSGLHSIIGTSSITEIHSLLEHFVSESLELVVSEDIVLRESAKEMLSSETHTGITIFLFAQFMISMNRFVLPTGEISISESRTLFVGQCVMIMKNLINRAASEPTSKQTMAMDFGSILMTVARYLNAAASQTHKALRERLLFAQMIEVFLNGHMRQTIVQEVNVRNDLLETFVNWITELRVMDPRTAHSDDSNVNKLTIDLTIWSMRAIVQILDKLPIKPLSGTYGQSGTGQSGDVQSLRSRAYRRYFDFFVRFMSQCRMVEIQEFSTVANAHTGSDSTTGPHAHLRQRGNRSESFASPSGDIGSGRDIARNIYSMSTTAAGQSQGNNIGQANRFSREHSQNAEILLDISIKALTKLLSSNLEVGLQYSLTVVYHEDPKLRTLFTDMLTNILNDGIDIDSLSKAMPEHWKARLVDALVDPDLKLALAINEVCQVQEIDDLSTVLITIFESRGCTMRLIEKFIIVELERTDSAAELFRRNCLATRLLSYYAKIHGDVYLKATLGPAIRKLMELPPGTLTFELNPNKMSELADRDRNFKNVERLCSLVIDSIIRSVPNMPAPFRAICNMIYRVVSARFPDAGYTAVGGFIFLRFLCPAIVAPDSHGIIGKIDNPEVRRGLLLCTKITHNLANDVPFGTKETYMVPLNRFITENRPRILRFLTEISEYDDDEVASIFEGTIKSIGSSSGPAGGRPSTEYCTSEADSSETTRGIPQTITKEFVVIQRFIFDHMDRLEVYLSRAPMARMNVPMNWGGSYRRPTMSNIVAAEQHTNDHKKKGNRISLLSVNISISNDSTTNAGTTGTDNLGTQVSYIMRQLGPPPVATGGSISSKITTIIDNTMNEETFYNILRRDSQKSTDSIAKKAIIYLGGVSRERRPVIYVIVRRLQIQYLDMDLVMLHIMRLLEPFTTKSYELFFDLTQFGPANEVQIQWLSQLRRLIPQSIVNNIQSVYWYNVNTHFRKYVKHNEINIPSRIAKRSVFPHSLSDLHEFLASPQADLPPGTVSLDGDGGISISPITRVSRSHSPIPCMVKITPEAIQITALRRQEVFGLSTYFNDVYHITEIADLQILPSSDRTDIIEAETESGGLKGRMALQRTGSRTSESERPSGMKNGRDENQLISIRFEGSTSALVFSSPKAELLFKAVRSARSRYNTHTTVPSAPERVIRPSDVPGTLLNIAILNCGAEHAPLRISAYRMLNSVVATFNIEVAHELGYAQDLCLPPNPLQFISRICAKLASSAPDMALELLSEALVSYTKSAPNMKLWILQYIRPWLLCLGKYTHNSSTHPDALQRTQDIITTLIRLNLKEPSMYVHFKEHVWTTLALIEDLPEILLDAFLTIALEYGALTVETELIADIIATLAGKNPRYNKLATRLRKLIMQTCTMCMPQISSHQLWPEIAVYLRLLLPISFSNRTFAEVYLPDVAFIICMLLRSGPGIIQATLHGIMLNVVHSLALTQNDGMIIDPALSSAIANTANFAGTPIRSLEGPSMVPDGNTNPNPMIISSYALLVQQLNDLSLAKTRYTFGLRSKTTSSVTYIASAYTRGGATSTLNAQALLEFKDELNSSAHMQMLSPQEILSSVENVAQIFLNIMDAPAYSDGRGNNWRARWTTLVTSSTFVFNPAVQPRAFMLLGKLVTYDEVDDDLLYQTLATLRGALASFSETDESLSISALTCLVNMVGNLPPDSSYLASLFWLAVAVLQIGSPSLFKVGLGLLTKVIRALDNCGAFSPENSNGFEDLLLSTRVTVEGASDHLDEIVGLSFRSSFSAALALLLLKGIGDVNTKDETYEAILLIISIVASCRKWQLAASESQPLDIILPYIMIVIPSAYVRGDITHIFVLSNLAITPEAKQKIELGSYSLFLEQAIKQDLKHKCSIDSILYPSIIAVMLYQTRLEHDITILYTILASNVCWVDTKTSVLVVESLAPTMTSAMRNSTSSKMTQKLHDIMVRLAIARPHFDPDLYLQQQHRKHHPDGSPSIYENAEIRKSMNASNTSGNRASHLPSPRIRDDSSDRNISGVGTIGKHHDSNSLMSTVSSSQSQNYADTAFDRNMISAHKEYLIRIEFGGIGRAGVFGTHMGHWKDLAELASMVIDHML